jgi:hypothetical protein
MEETPGGSLANAHYLATASDLAYYNAPETAPGIRSWGGV